MDQKETPGSEGKLWGRRSQPRILGTGTSSYFQPSEDPREGQGPLPTAPPCRQACASGRLR